MNPHDPLNRQLRQARAPEWSEAYHAQFVERLRQELASGAFRGPVRSPRRAVVPLLAFACAAAGILAGFLLWHRPAVTALRPLRVWVEVEDAGHRRALMAFSGDSIRLQGRKVEVLANPDGQVILVGDDFLWTNQDAVAAAASPQRIRAHLADRAY